MPEACFILPNWMHLLCLALPLLISVIALVIAWRAQRRGLSAEDYAVLRAFIRQELATLPGEPQAPCDASAPPHRVL